MGLPIARLCDPITCGDTIAKGSGNVAINGIPCARRGDKTAGHCYRPSPVKATSRTVFVNGKPIGRVTDSIQRHRCHRKHKSHNGKVAVGSPDVFAG
jgi:uncharacterized Zn-binding protein involved in type VI secretion